jgi:hypothetical protein
MAMVLLPVQAHETQIVYRNWLCLFELDFSNVVFIASKKKSHSVELNGIFSID